MLSIKRLGIGWIVIEKFCGIPTQPFRLGVTTRLPIKGVFTALVLKKLMFPTPLATSPIPGLEFVQLKVAPLVPLKLDVTASPGQTLWFAGTAKLGMELMVMLIRLMH